MIYLINSPIFFIISSFIATDIFRSTYCAGCTLLSSSRSSPPGSPQNVSKTCPYASNIFVFESRLPFVFLVIVFISWISSFTQSLFTFRAAKIKASPADANIRGSFLYLPFETVIWSLLDSLHILYQLHHMVSSLIHHMFVVSIDFIKLWDSYLGPVYRRVNVKLHCMMHHFQFHIPWHVYCFWFSSV